MHPFKGISVLLAAALAFSAQAQTTPPAPVSNLYVNTYDGTVHSVTNARAIIVNPGNFQVIYADGNVSDLIPDAAGTIFAKLRANAPALKSLMKVGDAGDWAVIDQVRDVHCQYGMAVPNSPVNSGGNYMLVSWWGHGYSLYYDQNCDQYNAIKVKAAQ